MSTHRALLQGVGLLDLLDTYTPFMQRWMYLCKSSSQPAMMELLISSKKYYFFSLTLSFSFSAQHSNLLQLDSLMFSVSISQSVLLHKVQNLAQSTEGPRVAEHPRCQGQSQTLNLTLNHSLIAKAYYQLEINLEKEHLSNELSM